MDSKWLALLVVGVLLVAGYIVQPVVVLGIQGSIPGVVPVIPRGEDVVIEASCFYLHPIPFIDDCCYLVQIYKVENGEDKLVWTSSTMPCLPCAEPCWYKNFHDVIRWNQIGNVEPYTDRYPGDGVYKVVLQLCTKERVVFFEIRG